MPSNEEVAGLLEEAARLYRDEKINWCQGAWRELPDPGKRKMSACADGALMRAAGFSWQQVDTLSEYVVHYHPTSGRMLQAKESYLAARDALSETPEGGCGIIPFNDSDGRTKEEVIDWFEATAKDLRNRAPAEEL
jgi:hypothetical protein